jgi:predicted unusual protein kinase regulating ubiquinone biosynthesis (AarF/ABC1/UbiB family)
MIKRRYRRIVLFFGRILGGFIFWDIVLPRIGLRGWAEKTRKNRIRKSAIAFRTLAIELGGVLIKVGQFLSTRVDVLPLEFTDELQGLQDEVPPVLFDEIRKVAEREFECSLAEKYSRFEQEPLAAASLGQVHLAWAKLPPDSSDAGWGSISSVVVKIQRPNIEMIIETDLAALRTVGNWLKRYPPIRKRANVPALIAEFSRILYEEVDYLAEGENAETFANNFSGDRTVRVPRILWSHTTRRVLTLENVWAIKITDYEAISAAGINRSDVASKLLDTYLKQIFEDGFFHADPHPGNLFIYPIPDQLGNPAEKGNIPWQLTFVDFGMVGRVPPITKAGMREMVIGVGTQDTGRILKSFQMLDMLLPGADLTLLEKAEAQAFERFWGKSMTELTSIRPDEIVDFTNEFRELLYTMPFQIPQDFIFLARAVGILSGMCTGLDPEFNVWEHLAPYARKLVAEEARSSPEYWIENLRNLVTAFFSYPIKVQAALNRLERGDISIRIPEITQSANRIERAMRQIAASLVFVGLFIGAIQLYLAGQGIFAAVVFGMAALILFWIALQGVFR